LLLAPGSVASPTNRGGNRLWGSKNPYGEPYREILMGVLAVSRLSDAEKAYVQGVNQRKS
jgi:hypothetical protein